VSPKLFLVGMGDDINDDEDVGTEAAFDDDQFMGFHDARFILLTVAEWSRAHGVSWEVEMAGEGKPPNRSRQRPPMSPAISGRLAAVCVAGAAAAAELGVRPPGGIRH
jgi:hypothetical protein